MGVAGLIFEPHPPYFANQYNFWRCANDVSMIFSYLYWFQIYQKTQKPVPPVHKDLPDLSNHKEMKGDAKKWRRLFSSFLISSPTLQQQSNSFDCNGNSDTHR